MASGKSRENTRPLCAACLLALAALVQPLLGDRQGTTAALSQDDRFQSVAQKGLAQRDKDSVVAYYNKALAETRSNSEKAQMSLAFAGALERTARSTGQAALLRESEQYYRNAMELSEGEVRFKAANNYCAQLLRSDRPREAVELMGPVIPNIVSDPSLSATAKSRSLYNYGKALELSGNIPEACQVLSQAMKADPSFDKAAQSVAALALGAPHESVGIPQLLDATGVQLTKARYDEVASSLRTALTMDRWARHPLHADLVRQLVRYFTAAKVSPEAFRERWGEFLGRLQSKDALNAQSKRLLEQIEMVYAMKLGIRFSPGDTESRFRILRRDDQPLLSELLSMLGDRYYRTNDRRRALAYYSRAWSLNTSNMQAGLYAADLLLLDQKNANDRIDPQGKLLSEFIDELFSAKGGAYLGNDWNRILRFHILLGTIFESQGRWGPRYDPASAYFQWERARSALERADADVKKEFQAQVEQRFRRAQERAR